MPKPFGKPVLHRLALTPAMRLSLALLGAALPAYLIGHVAASGYPTLAPRPFFWGAALVLAVFYAAATARWLRRHPSPRPPGASSRRGLFVSRFLLTLLLALPAGFLSAFLYGPALTLANGLVSPGSSETELAMALVRPDGEVELHLLYRAPGSTWTVPTSRLRPREAAPWMSARMTLRRGILGAQWVERIDYESLR
jgi:hypothetical protein